MISEQLVNLPEHRIWRGMIRRCANFKSKYYGAKGVKVCDEWRNSFGVFYEHVGPRPSPLHTIDRYPDGNGDYRPGNVRWATRQEQNRNRHQGLITLDGITRHTWEWSELSGVPAEIISKRISKGMAPERAVWRPVNGWSGADGGGLSSKQRSDFNRGARNYSAKLDDDMVRKVRVLRKQGVRVIDIANLFHVSGSCISDVLSGRRWKHVPEGLSHE
jgi:hypothetical protein